MDGIEAFWSWWSAGAAADLADRFDRGAVDGVVDLVAPRVDAVAPGLSWEFGAGESSRHRLVVTSGGDPTLRRVARRWLRAAPPPDAAWSFADVSPPARGAVVFDLGGHTIDAASATFASRQARGGLDVAVHHPAFSRLDERTRSTATFLLLDSLLGADVVELWVGQVVAVAAPGPDLPLAAVVTQVADVVRRGTSPNGEVAFVVLRGGTDDAPVVRRRRVRLSPVQSPEHDEHVQVEVTFDAVRPDGMPTEDGVHHADALEQHLLQRLGSAAYLVAVETGQGRRLMHWFVDSTTPAAEQLRVAAGGWQQGRVTVGVAEDPAWTAVAGL